MLTKSGGQGIHDDIDAETPEVHPVLMLWNDVLRRRKERDCLSYMHNTGSVKILRVEREFGLDFRTNLLKMKHE